MWVIIPNDGNFAEEPNRQPTPERENLCGLTWMGDGQAIRRK